MAALNLSETDLAKVRGSWADVMERTKSSTTFAKTAFAKLLFSNPELKPIFADTAVYNSQQQLFGELLDFTMTYLHKLDILAECTDEYVKENPQLVTVGVHYLEPMGAVIIGTLRDVLGSSFHAGLETLWIKVYIFIANCILQNEVSDAEMDLDLSQDSIVPAKEPVHPVEEPIRPLEVRAPKLAPAEQPGATLNVDLSKEKYRGFRRSVSEDPSTPVQVKMPASPYDFRLPARSTSPESYDPRGREEPVLTPRSLLRNSSLQLQTLCGSASGSESCLVLSRGESSGSSASSVSGSGSLASPVPFDPRKKGHRRTPSDLSLNMELRSVSGSSGSSGFSASSGAEDDDACDYQIDFSQSIKRNPVFDSNSFGIKGLAPIVESEHDDESHYSDGSSGYNRKTSEDEYSSRTSSLSLHNLGYKSSVSSSHSPVEKIHKQTVSDVSSMAPISNPYPMLNRAFSSSVPSFSLQGSSGQRASLGFMRSSFILKKEMREMGYNEPENVVLKPQAPALRLIVNVTLRSVTSLPLPAPTIKSEVSLLEQKLEEPKAQIEVSEKKELVNKKERMSLRKKFSSIFGTNRKSPLVISAPISAPISSPAPVPVLAPVLVPESAPTPKTHRPAPRKSSRASVAPSTAASVAPSTAGSFGRASHRLSSIDLRLAPVKPAGYAASVYLRNTSDSASVMSNSTGKTGFFSFKGQSHVKHNNENQDKKANKYLVLKLPYKTVYVKDLIRS